MILLVLALVGGTLTAFAVTQSLKLERSPLTAPRFDKRFSPVCRCEQSRARLAFRLRKPDRLDLALLDRDGRVVRALGQDRPYERGAVRLLWDGRDGAGLLVPDGPYRLRVHLDRSRRTVVIPNAVLVDSKPPKLEAVRLTRQLISPDGDGRRDALAVVYRSSEKAAPTLLVDGRVAVRGRMRASGRSRLFWHGRRDGAALMPGSHTLALALRDRAGNLRAPARIGAVRIRYLELVRSQGRTLQGGTLRFRVRADAASFTWQLLRQPQGGVVLSGSVRGRAVRVRLPEALVAGRYLLRATAAGHSDSATVLVERARP